MNSMNSLCDAIGDLNYEQVQNTVGKIMAGEVGIERLSGQGEQGRIEGSGLCVGASLIVGAETRTNSQSEAQKRRNKEEELLEEYAKSQGSWIEDIDAFKRTLDGSLPPSAEVSA